jgi:hypothetical protein
MMRWIFSGLIAGLIAGAALPTGEALETECADFDNDKVGDGVTCCACSNDNDMSLTDITNNGGTSALVGIVLEETENIVLSYTWYWPSQFLTVNANDTQRIEAITKRITMCYGGTAYDVDIHFGNDCDNPQSWSFPTQCNCG